MGITRPERKIAIAFIRPFRDHIDRMLKPTCEHELTSLRIRENVDHTVELMVADGIEVPDDLCEGIKTLMVDMNVSGAKALIPLYFKLLSSLIDSVHSHIEKRLLEMFTTEELDQLASIADMDVIQKLLNMRDLYDFMAQERKNMKSSLQEALFDHIEREGYNEQMNSLFAELMKRTGGRGFGWNFFHDDDPTES